MTIYWYPLWLAQCLEFCSRFPVTLFNSTRQFSYYKTHIHNLFNIWFLIFLTSFFYNNLVLSLTYPLALLPVPPLLLKSSTISISTTTYFPSSLQHSSAISSSCPGGPQFTDPTTSTLSPIISTLPSSPSLTLIVYLSLTSLALHSLHHTCGFKPHPWLKPTFPPTVCLYLCSRNTTILTAHFQRRSASLRWILHSTIAFPWSICSSILYVTVSDFLSSPQISITSSSNPYSQLMILIPMSPLPQVLTLPLTCLPPPCLYFWLLITMDEQSTPRIFEIIPSLKETAPANLPASVFSWTRGSF